MVKVTKSQVKNLFETVVDTFDRQFTSTPVIFSYAGKVDISRGDTLAGTASVVYDRTADILLSTAQLEQYYLDYIHHELNKKESINFLYNDILSAIV